MHLENVMIGICAIYGQALGLKCKENVRAADVELGGQTNCVVEPVAKVMAAWVVKDYHAQDD